jgi:hypothetical protein
VIRQGVSMEPILLQVSCEVSSKDAIKPALPTSVMDYLNALILLHPLTSIRRRLKFLPLVSLMSLPPQAQLVWLGRRPVII